MAAETPEWVVREDAGLPVLVALYLRRDETAVRQTAEKYGSRLRTLAYGIVNDLQTAEESCKQKSIAEVKKVPQNLHS